MGFHDISRVVKTTVPARPMIYSYTTPEVAKHHGWSKIGYTEQDVDDRIVEQVRTADVTAEKQWQGRAEFDDGKEPLTFKDYDLHAYLTRCGVERGRHEGTDTHSEWFHVDGPTGKRYFDEFRQNRGLVESGEAAPYDLREEQEEAVERTGDYFLDHEDEEGKNGGEYLWNAKPRFGKTLTAYDFCQTIDAKYVLVVTNRPAIADSWYKDYAKFFGTQSGWRFVSEVYVLQDKAKFPLVTSREDYVRLLTTMGKDAPGCIEFVSLQDLKGGLDFGGKYDKLEHVKTMLWDVLIVDEAHEGVDTAKTDVAFTGIRRKFTLHLSGTPFKAMAANKFPSDAVYSWTYADEQARKRQWPLDHPGEENPYGDLPKLHLLTYKMSDIVETVAAEGIDIDGENHEYAFDLNEFFACDDQGRFRHDEDVDRFLDALTTETKYPFSTPELRGELRHTLWMVGGDPRPTDSARALAKKLETHPVFKNYKVVLAVGDPRKSDDETERSALANVRRAIESNERTITLSVGQLTTGVTVPEWTGVLMLSNMTSSSLYMQAAFRCQNPWLEELPDGKFRRKENAYVFDFDPARTLAFYEDCANGLYEKTAGGKGTAEEHKHHVRELLNFLPVLGEDEDGTMVELDAEKVLLIPRHIYAQEVVRHGFISNFLFQNIGRVFNAPQGVIDSILGIEMFKEASKEVDADEESRAALELNEKGEVEIPRDTVIGLAQNLFGEKLYGDVAADLDGVIRDMTSTARPMSEEDAALDHLVQTFADHVTNPIMDAARDYTQNLKPAQRKRVEKKLHLDAEASVGREVGSYKAERNRIEVDHKKAVAAATTLDEVKAADDEYEKRHQEACEKLEDRLQTLRDDVVMSSGEAVVEAVETSKREAKKAALEEEIRHHLNGFARTIPSFLMAYGDETTTLANFDQMVSEDVFEEVTTNTKTGEHLTLEWFRLMRDGGTYVNPKTGQEEQFGGCLFDETVFDDSIREFIRLRSELADYFDSNHDHVIFDYIPNQRSNLIFTPKRVVTQMVDLFEQENPGCFDDPDHTFADLYMKSGLFITEIVTRLYNSDGMRAAYPDGHERLRHIFERQVFGAAPTQILYDITTHFILGYEGEVAGGFDTNFVMADTAELAKEGKLAEWVQRTFGGKL